MSDLNKVMLIGRLGADPELKHIPNGQAVCEFRIATSSSWTKDGEKHEKTEWHRIKVWGKAADACAKYLAKGRQVYVEGRIETRTYEKNGEKRYATEINATDVQFLGGKGEREAGGSSAPVQSAPQQTGGGTYGPDDDLPFLTSSISADDDPIRRSRRP